MIIAPNMKSEAYLNNPKFKRSEGRMVMMNASINKPEARTANKRKKPHVIPIPKEAALMDKAARMLETAIVLLVKSKPYLDGKVGTPAA